MLCPTLCNPIDCSAPGYAVCGISQGRILEQVAISFSQKDAYTSIITYYLLSINYITSNNDSQYKANYITELAHMTTEASWSQELQHELASYRLRLVQIYENTFAQSSDFYVHCFMNTNKIQYFQFSNEKYPHQNLTILYLKIKVTFPNLGLP